MHKQFSLSPIMNSPKGEPCEDNEEVLQLTARLRKLKKSLKEFENCHYVTGHQIHPLIREEIAKIYDEHGGLSLLIKLTKVGFHTIKKWHSKYKANPLVFREMPLHGRCYRTRQSPDSLKNMVQSQSEVNQYLKQDELYKEAKTPQEMRSLLSADLLEVLDRVKVSIDEGQTLTPDQKMEIAGLVIKAGSARPISLLLGLNRKVILSWKGYLAQVVNQIKHKT